MAIPICKVKYVIFHKNSQGRIDFLLKKNLNKKAAFYPAVEIYDEKTFLETVRAAAVKVLGLDMLGVPMIVNDVVELEEINSVPVKTWYYGFSVNNVDEIRLSENQQWLDTRKAINSLDNIHERAAIRELDSTLTLFQNSTRGEKKKKQYVERILKTEKFIELVKKYQHTQEKTKLYLEIAGRYGIDLLTLLEAERIGKGEAKMDMVQILDRRYQLQAKKRFSNAKPDIFEETEIIANPVALVLNLHATSKDVKDMVEKNWITIEGLLEKYRQAKVPNIQARPMSKREQRLIKELSQHREKVNRGEKLGDRNLKISDYGNYGAAYNAERKARGRRKSRNG